MIINTAVTIYLLDIGACYEIKCSLCKTAHPIFGATAHSLDTSFGSEVKIVHNPSYSQITSMKDTDARREYITADLAHFPRYTAAVAGRCGIYFENQRNGQNEIVLMSKSSLLE